MAQNEPIYNIGAVSRMTDIPAATLRVWERRYGFPEASRTEGGHRLYSDTDVQQLRWVKARIDEGMQTRQAVRALRVSQEEAAAQAVSALIEETEVGSYLERLKNRLIDALMRLETAEANKIFDEALAVYSPEDVILQMIRTTLWEIGEGWARGEVSIGVEHFASHYLRQRLLPWLTTGPPPYAVPPTVLACAPGEYHEGGLMILGALLRRRRWPVAYLGQSIPLEDLAKFVHSTAYQAIVTVAMDEKTAEALSEWPRWLPELSATGSPIFAFGGRVFNQRPEWREKVRGLFLGATLTEGVETLEQALRKSAPLLT